MNRGPFISFIDVFALMLIVLFLLPMKPDLETQDESRAGMLVVEAHWPNNMRSDVDLWVKAPGDKPVGFTRLRGTVFSLFRDDVGSTQHPWRYETAAARDIRDGEYITTVHLYSDRDDNAPIEVDVSVWYRTEISSKRQQVWSGSVVLEYPNQEVIAVRWNMKDGRFVPGSIHHSPAFLFKGDDNFVGDG